MVKVRMNLIFGLAFILSGYNLLAYTTPFVTFDKNFVPQNPIVLTNMPPVRSQDGVGNCSSFALSAIFDYNTCKDSKIECSKISDDKRVSVLAISKYAEDPDNVSNPNDPKSYNKIVQGASAANTCQNLLLNISKIPKESCAPFDLLMNIQTTTPTEQNKNFKKLEDNYNTYQKNQKDCPNCIADEIAKLFPFFGNRSKILSALGQPEFGNFLHQLLMPEKCLQDEKNQIIIPDKVIDYYPKEGLSPNNESMIKKIKMVLNEGKGNPVMVDGLCMDDVNPPTSKGCSLSHSVVISGYSKMCDKNNKCYDALKIHNSWGQKWQNENGDGWVLADEFLNRTHLSKGTLSWLN